jgi:hypothetical protein
MVACCQELLCLLHQAVLTSAAVQARPVQLQSVKHFSAWVLLWHVFISLVCCLLSLLGVCYCCCWPLFEDAGGLMSVC